MKSPDMENPAPRIPTHYADAPDIPPEAFALILRTLKNLKGFNLDIYKEKCIKRRIAIRIRKTGYSSAMEYVKFLLRDEAEPDHLLKVITIHVSQFFRNPTTFQKLKDDIFPYLFSLCEKEHRDRFKLWSVGCAGGEEPYTAALILKEHFADIIARRETTILASDVDPEIIETARIGVYRNERLLEVPPLVKDRWFAEDDGKFKLAQEIMDMVTFRQSDLYDIDTFPESDLILCRNVLIYLERSHQEKILKGFANALRTGGMLVLGKAETLVGESRWRFQTVCPIERIYRLI